MESGKSPTNCSDLFVEELLSDMARLGSRPYAEIGVPMFLVAEDLTEGSSRATVQTTNGHDLATLFAQMAKALSARKPDLDASDIARLVEILADRYFLAFAMPAFSTIPELHSEKK